MARATKTTEHDTIRRWVESRGGHPAHVTRTQDDDDPGVLRIDFPGYSGEESLERIDWAEWFEWFDRNELAFLYQDEADSRFNKLVSRGDENGAEESSGSRSASSGKQR